MKKNKLPKNLAVWVIGIALILVLAIGGSQGWFKSLSVTNINQTTQQFLDSALPSGECTLSISPSSIYTGDSVKGTISNGKNALCYVIVNDGTGWSIVYSGTTNSNGVLTAIRVMDSSGNYVVRAVCDTNKNGMLDTQDCITNSASLKVSEKAGDCIDSDGDNRDTPGHVTYNGYSYYDKCLEVGQAVNETICVNGKMSSKNWMCDYGEECLQSRSGGYCVKSTPTYNIGDEVGEGQGVFNNLGGQSSNIFEIDLDVGVGDTSICAKIEVGAVLSGSNCIPGMPPVKFEFYDSYNKKWEKTEQVDFSTFGNPAIVPVSWDGQTKFRMIVSNLGYCNVNTNAIVRIVVC